MKANYRANQDHYYRRMKIYYIKLKIEALTHYSTKPYPACVRCGITDIRVLSIDHINGGGSTHRLHQVGHGGAHLYAFLKRNSWPEGYQTLCMNDQFKKRWENREVKTSLFRT